ncbi:Tubby-like F-box protein 5 [Vitis vinifera]|uniref:Tubby-like F-box protein 5 n=1 Tax=Vitis vinifera TaxID=29760 RepID=A0A438EVV3_VITVI|nr:Tubby-like F-box protein 5 [Vitis vinifera]
MSFKSIVRELKEMKDGIGNISRRGVEGKHWRRRTRSYIAPDQGPSLEPSNRFVGHGGRLQRRLSKTPEECGRLTFPISLKQPGPRDSPIQCFIRRDRATSTYLLYFGLTPSEGQSDKLLLAARRIRRPTSTDFVISLVADDFSRASNTYVGKLRSNFLGTKFTIYDSQPPYDTAVQPNSRSSRRFHSKQVSPRVPACNYSVATISYELNVLRTRGPRRMQCTMHSIPISSIQEGGTAPTPTSFPQPFDEQFSPSPCLRKRIQSQTYAPQALASVKNFQLVASVEPSHNVSAVEQDKVILQFGKIGKDIFTMDYRYPLSAFQAFAICLSSFDTKPACE